MFVLPHSTTVPLLRLKLDLDYFLSSPTQILLTHSVFLLSYIFLYIFHILVKSKNKLFCITNDISLYQRYVSVIQLKKHSCTQLKLCGFLHLPINTEACVSFFYLLGLTVSIFYLLFVFCLSSSASLPWDDIPFIPQHCIVPPGVRLQLVITLSLTTELCNDWSNQKTIKEIHSEKTSYRAVTGNSDIYCVHQSGLIIQWSDNI